MNTGFLKIVKGLHSYRSQVPFEAWIKRIMINAVIDHHRQHKRYRETISFDERPLDSYGGHVDLNEADKMFDAEQLQYFIRQLPPVSHQVFCLYALDGYSHKEIGHMLKISDGTSKWHLSNARKKLQAMIRQAMVAEYGRQGLGSEIGNSNVKAAQ